MNCRLVIPLVCLLVFASCHLPSPAPCVDFGAPLVLGTVYGSSTGLAPGSIAFTTAGIPVILRRFTMSSGNNSFGFAQLVNPPFVFASGQSLRLNNISVEFYFGNAQPVVQMATLAFLDTGGNENLSINGAQYVGDIRSVPPSLAGVSISVSTVPLSPPSLGVSGRLTLKGVIHTFAVGGQEFWIDDLCVK